MPLKGGSFCKSFSSQLRSYRLRRRCIAPIFPPLFDRSIVPASRSLFLFPCVVLNPGASPCQTSSVCTRIGYELFMASERANERAKYGRKSDFMYYRSPDAIYNRREPVARAVTFFSVWFTLISAPIRTVAGESGSHKYAIAPFRLMPRVSFLSISQLGKLWSSYFSIYMYLSFSSCSSPLPLPFILWIIIIYALLLCTLSNLIKLIGF